MKKRTVMDFVKGYSLSVLLGAATISVAAGPITEFCAEQHMLNEIDRKRVAAGMKSAKETGITDDMYERAMHVAKLIDLPYQGLTRVQTIDLLLKSAESNARLPGRRQISRLDLAEAKEKMTYAEFTELQAREAKDNPAPSTSNVDFTPEIVARIKKLQEINFQSYVNIIKKRPTNKRLQEYINEAERFMKEDNWIEAEIALERIDNELTPEQAALVQEAHVKGHYEKVSQGEYSLYEDYMKSPYNKATPKYEVPTPEQARETTIQKVEEYERLRSCGGHNSAPRVNLKDFGIEGFDIDPFEIERVPYNPPKPEPIPVHRTTPADLRGR